MSETPTLPPPHKAASAALYLRSDGTLLLVRQDREVEMTLQPAQLLQLGIDALRVATALQPGLMAAAVDALANTHVVPWSFDPTRPLS